MQSRFIVEWQAPPKGAFNYYYTDSQQDVDDFIKLAHSNGVTKITIYERKGEQL